MIAVKRNLRDELGNPPGGRRVMYCPACDSQASAHAGDYWDVPADHVFLCECGETMRIGVPFSGVYEVEGGKQ
jgi:hypothetical protein